MRFFKLVLAVAIVFSTMSFAFGQKHVVTSTKQHFSKSDISHITIGKGKGDGDLIGD